MNYYLKYKKYKNKYYLLKHGGSSPEIILRKRIESLEWSNAKWLVFVEAIFVLYGIREMVITPGNHMKFVNHNHVIEVFDELKSNNLLENLKLIKGNIFLFNDEKDKFEFMESNVIFRESTLIDFKKIGLENTDIDEEYIGKMLGFDDCSNKLGNFRISVITVKKQVSVMDYLCDKDNIEKLKVKLQILSRFIYNDDYLRNVFSTINNTNYFFVIKVENIETQEEIEILVNF